MVNKKEQNPRKYRGKPVLQCTKNESNQKTKIGLTFQAFFHLVFLKWNGNHQGPTWDGRRRKVVLDLFERFGSWSTPGANPIK